MTRLKRSNKDLRKSKQLEKEEKALKREEKTLLRLYGNITRRYYLNSCLKNADTLQHSKRLQYEYKIIKQFTVRIVRSMSRLNAIHKIVDIDLMKKSLKKLEDKQIDGTNIMTLTNIVDYFVAVYEQIIHAYSIKEISNCYNGFICFLTGRILLDI